MFHDKRRWCVRPAETPEEVATCVTRQTWPHCAAIEIDGYLFLNDSLPEDVSTDYAVVKRPAEPDGRFVQVAGLILGCVGYEDALGRVRRALAGEYDGLADNFEVEPYLEPAAEQASRCCPFCTPTDADRAAMLASLPDGY